MIHMTLAQAAHILGLDTILSPDISFHGISIDTRTLEPGNLFVAIPGEQADGHDFIENARQKNAAATLVSRKTNTTLPQILVDDTTRAMGKLCTAWRDHLHPRVAAVTGSNGKTTVKNMLASIMAAACQDDEQAVLSTQGTLNNHWGVPLTLARLNHKHRYAVIEMGMNHFGEIASLTAMAKPDVAVITNAAACHLEGLGDVAGVARAKAEIFSGLAKNGTAILNRDDTFFSFWQERIDHRPYITFGFHPEAQVTAVIHQADTSQNMTLQTPQGHITVQLPLPGKHNVQNALAAAAAALAAGIDLKAIQSGLENCKPAPGRLLIHTLANGVKIIDDTYNANPFSLQAAVNLLAACEGKKILVLGDMKELGNEAEQLHQDAGTAIREAGIHYLFTYGELSENTAKNFGEGAYHFNQQEKLVNALKPLLCNTTAILVKGSRSMQMDKIVAELIA